MNTKLIKTEKDYEVAVKRLEKIFDASPNSKEGDEAEVLSMLIDSYENQHYPIEAPDSIELLQEVQSAEQQIIDGKHLTSNQVEKRSNARYSK